MNTLYVRNKAQKILFEMELQGQLSVGWWENENTDERLWNCAVKVADSEEELGCNFAVKYHTNFCDEELVEWVGLTMIDFVNDIDPKYDLDQLIIDLNDLTNIVYIWEED